MWQRNQYRRSAMKSFRDEIIYLLLNKTFIRCQRATGSFLTFKKGLVSCELGYADDTWRRKSTLLHLGRPETNERPAGPDVMSNAKDKAEAEIFSRPLHSGDLSNLFYTYVCSICVCTCMQTYFQSMSTHIQLILQEHYRLNKVLRIVQDQIIIYFKKCHTDRN